MENMNEDSKSAQKGATRFPNNYENDVTIKGVGHINNGNMNKKIKEILKNIFLYLNLAVTTLCILLLIYGKIKNNSFTAYDSKLFHIHIYIFYFNLLLCIIGIILSIKYLICKRKKYFSENYVSLVPSIIMSVIFFYTIIMTLINNLFTGGMVIPALILAIGTPLFLFYYINQKYNIIVKILCLLFPINVIFSCFLMWLLAMY